MGAGKIPHGDQTTCIGVIIALRSEACGLLPWYRRAGSRCAAAMIAVSGTGADRAVAAADALVRRGAGVLVSWGSAGALVEHLAPGALLLPQRLIDAKGNKRGVDEGWHATLLAQLSTQFSVCTDSLVESGRVVCSEGRKRALGRQHRAAAVDMESAALARFAAERGVPFVAVRAIADPVTLSLPEYVGKAVEPGGLRVGSVLSQAVRQPGDWATLLRMGRNFHAARRTLARAAHHLSLFRPVAWERAS